MAFVGTRYKGVLSYFFYNDRMRRRGKKLASSAKSAWTRGIVTFAIFTCQSSAALIGRSKGNQWLGEFHGGAGPLQNRLFLSNVTMPSPDVLRTQRRGSQKDGRTGRIAEHYLSAGVHLRALLSRAAKNPARRVLSPCSSASAARSEASVTKAFIVSITC